MYIYYIYIIVLQIIKITLRVHKFVYLYKNVMAPVLNGFPTNG